ncbi:acetyl-CoA synthetase-like protein [Pseudovirgaria hyperparasitica]|uniref:Acetyl-CoA synthetase-like protein n=1 Tax=Pseudovirgaria hyperparasitica TaxID=470096 RepID=A0A6A6WAZ8_9PEZI|nr:acetyl-CoA synthetase-like protein [Pseudovirgaria hyperparasitica]KAF2758301.1 acetyl-CoA synthetase-like protein [Pseudovirgaria hyperparasitica]
MKGYWNKPKETEETFADGWLKTGGIAVIDDEGEVTIVNQMKVELIKVKGLHVAPAELEALPLENKDVADAAFIGVSMLGPLSDNEERPRAYIIPQEGAIAGEKDISDYLAGRVSKAKRSTGDVIFTKDISKNPE